MKNLKMPKNRKNCRKCTKTFFLEKVKKSQKKQNSSNCWFRSETSNKLEEKNQQKRKTPVKRVKKTNMKNTKFKWKALDVVFIQKNMNF